MQRKRQGRLDDPRFLIEEYIVSEGDVLRVWHKQIARGSEVEVFVETESGAGRVKARGPHLEAKAGGKTKNTFRLLIKLDAHARPRLKASGEYEATAEVVHVPEGPADAVSIRIPLIYKARSTRAARPRKGR
jgi:hypothetical protein